jgi:retron-type reverse transcriptase
VARTGLSNAFGKAQDSLKLILEPIFEADFQPGSYGYRPKRTAHQAVARVAGAIVQQKTCVIDLDLRAYFDTVRHYLLQKVAHLPSRSLRAAWLRSAASRR